MRITGITLFTAFAGLFNPSGAKEAEFLNGLSTAATTDAHESLLLGSDASLEKDDFAGEGRALQEAPTAGVTEQDVRDLFQLWNDALLTQDPDTVARRYTRDAVLLPTVSDTPRDTHELIEDYFVHFLAGEPSGEILESFVHIGYDWVMDVGIYEFTMATDGSQVRGRYSYVYAMEDGEWRIIHHHSSMMPEPMLAAAAGESRRALQGSSNSTSMNGNAPTDGVTEQDVRDLFVLWNDALKTGNPDTVARRYTSDAVLLPTVSDIPRSTHYLIEDYFVHFLEGEPTGEIIESFVHIGHDWVMDSGIYEFTMGTDGSVVRGRYTYVYAMEDGEWRIVHHHSSMMPEPMIAAAEAPTAGVTEQDVRDLFQLWNNALLTQDPDTVARRYTRDAVLLPTVSDTPRDTHELIEDYFVHFLAGEPSGEIIESFVHIGYDWVMDVGIYEFTMATDGSVVRGRYSYVYAMEDGEWRIIHHHSSMMPEPMLAAAGQRRALQATTVRRTQDEMSSSHGRTDVTEQDVRDLFQLWNAALQTGDPDTVAQRYTSDAVLLPTVSDIPRDTHELIEDYFVHFLEGEPSGEIIESFVHIGHDWVMDTGIYEFTMATDGSVVRGRYSFVYAMEDGEWRIVHHHSSMMPEPMLAAAESAPTAGVTEADVRGLFSLWNAALLTLDPDTVARRYTRDAVLLPTVSDTPRDTHELIEDYFVHFLAGEPSGEILESFVHIGYDWVMDVGIYEFTMATDGSQVRGRYSYVYAMEDGEWKIIHHHSSMMPEPMLAAAAAVEQATAPGKRRELQGTTVHRRTEDHGSVTEQDVRDLFSLWNDALQTGDPDTVAQRYTSDAVLLPTVSDIPRDTHELIEDYFVHFLEGEPSGEIIESFVHIGHDWVMDTGIYEFTMATDGSVVRGRYSFVYAMENGEWKILHHHSSMMPEPMLAAASSAPTAGVSEQDVRDLFQLWNAALQTLNPDTVARRYTSDAVLLPTVSDTPRDTHELIEDYFVHFLEGEPTGEILESFVHIGYDWVMDVGIYEFTMGTDGSQVRGRYSYVYAMEDGEWKIIHHHSSMMPEPMLAAAGQRRALQGTTVRRLEDHSSGAGPTDGVTEQDVRNLFSLWNDALLTQDPDTVARRYTRDAVLLPTVSDTPRDTHELIEDYFVHFLEGEPSGEIIESFVHIGHDWVMDTGIYEFTMATDGSQVRGRYSYVYAMEDGEWKILHHHSSMMPEPMLAAAASAPTAGVTEQDVRDLFQLWNAALQTNDPDTVARRYTSDAVLLPTVSDTPRDTHELIEDYFVHFLEGEPTGEIIESFVHIGYDWVMDVGIYEFTMGTDGSVIRGRYSYVYAMEDGEWRIVHHHSSMMPEGMIAAAEGGRALQGKSTVHRRTEDHSNGGGPTEGVSEEDVQNLFSLWNDALQTGNPDTVARRYTSDAVLLPTVSDIPRSTHFLIEDYFVHFLEGEPTGEIIESFVHIGHDWVMDVGIYEFTMGTDGSVVRGRYSFVYAMEDGEWKIVHHHSSMMPEPMLAAAEDGGSAAAAESAGFVAGKELAILGATVAAILVV